MPLKGNAELKKNYEDILVAYGVLKSKIDTLAQPSSKVYKSL